MNLSPPACVVGLARATDMHQILGHATFCPTNEFAEKAMDVKRP